jgi:hypothetical protein
MTALDLEGSTRASVPGHFRVWKDVYDSLEDEARTKRISLNTLVNQVLSNHTRDDLLLEEEGFVKMTKNTLRVVFSLIPDDKLAEFGRLAAKNGPDARMLARSNKITLDTVLDELRLFSRSGWYSLKETKKNGQQVISLMYDIGPTTGPRQSVVLSAYVTGLFALVGVRPKITTTSTSVTIEY